MSRFFIFLTLILLTFVFYGFYISQFEFNLIDTDKSGKTRINLFYDYKIALNVYSTLSSGSGNPLTISSEAKKARVQFVLLSDTNSSFDVGQDRYIDRVGILNGNKIEFNSKSSDFENNQRKIIHYSARQKTYDLTQLSNYVQNPHDLTIAAHLIKNNYKLTQLKNFEFDGLEVINFKSITQNSWKQSLISTLWSILYYPFNPRLALMRLYTDPKNEIAVFDQLSQLRPVNFYLGTEASARAVPFADWLIRFPSYEVSFSTASQHLMLLSELTGEIEKDKIKILTALKNGRSYVAFDALGDPSGFETYLIDQKQKYFTGDHLQYKKNLKIYYRLPAEPNSFYEVVLFKNGQRVDHLNTGEGQFNLNSPGVYRIQVRLSPRLPLPDAVKWISWIYTNNFYVK